MSTDTLERLCDRVIATYLTREQRAVIDAGLHAGLSADGIIEIARMKHGSGPLLEAVEAYVRGKS